MGRFLVVTWDGAGNLLSTLGIARRLAQRGHDVRLLGHRSIQRRYGDRGWRFLPFHHTPTSIPRCQPTSRPSCKV